MPHSNSKCHDLKLELAKLAELIKEKRGQNPTSKQGIQTALIRGKSRTRYF
jgi:hypothetical protein